MTAEGNGNMSKQQIPPLRCGMTNKKASATARTTATHMRFLFRNLYVDIPSAGERGCRRGGCEPTWGGCRVRRVARRAISPADRRPGRVELADAAGSGMDLSR